MTDPAEKYKAQEDDEYLTRVVIDTCARTFRLYSNEGDERVVDCDTIDGLVFSGLRGSTLSAELSSGGDDGGACDDADGDGVCDDVDDCVGAYDECGVCNGDGIADGACDCDGNVTDCAGDCGGSAVVDECGECGGDGSSCAETTVAILYDSDADIYGFQFNG